MYQVLLADDEPSVTECLAMLDWNQYGFSICGTAQNGEDALKIMQRCDPDLVITDIKMPVIDGLKLIRLARESNFKAKFIILSGYGEFSFAREALRMEAAGYILKPFDTGELEETIGTMAQQFRNERVKKEYADKRRSYVAGQTLRSILEGEGGEQAIEMAAQLLGMDSGDEIQCLLVDIGLNQTDSGLNLAKKMKVRSTLESALGEFRQYLFEDGEERLGILLTRRMPFYHQVDRFAGDLAAMLASAMDGPVLLSQSARATGLDQLALVHAQSRLALSFAFFFTDTCLIRYEDIRSRTVDTLPCMENPAELIAAITGGAANSIEPIVRGLFSRFRETGKAPDSVRAFIRNLEFEAIKLVGGLNGNTETFMQTVVELDRGIDFYSISELQDAFLSFCAHLSNIIGSLKRSGNRDIVAEVKNYIQNHYNQDVKLKDLASVFYMNPNYLGQLFKKTTGMQFNDYLHRVRINEAKKLLKRTRMKIADIALAVGYNDSKYFLSKFRSIEQQSPSDYKLNNT